jgi:Ran GTPase-activating protein (RanGAP) involved in mRNA processing and transport
MFPFCRISLGYRNTTLHEVTLVGNHITSTGVGVLLEAMEQSSHHITYLDLQYNRICNEGAIFLAMALANYTLSSLASLLLSDCGISDDGFITLLSALK